MPGIGAALGRQRAGHTVAGVYEHKGISGAKGPRQAPRLVVAPPSLLEEINSVFLSDYLKDASQIKGRVGCGPCSLDLPPFWPANHSYNSAACI